MFDFSLDDFIEIILGVERKIASLNGGDRGELEMSTG